jgi:hypothetical protein
MSRYFNKAANFAANNYQNYYGNMIPNFSNANGASAMAAPSNPYNFIISNSSTIPLTVTLLDSYNANIAGVANFGNDERITITMDSGSGVSYGSFLQTLTSTPFSIGQIYLDCQNSAQITNTLTFRYQQNDGTFAGSLENPFIDPMQNQSTVLMYTPQRIIPINGYTKCTFTLLGSATLKMKIFPAIILDGAQPLVGASPEQAFSPINISQNPLARRIG